MFKINRINVGFTMCIGDHNVSSGEYHLLVWGSHKTNSYGIRGKFALAYANLFMRAWENLFINGKIGSKLILLRRTLMNTFSFGVGPKLHYKSSPKSWIIQTGIRIDDSLWSGHFLDLSIKIIEGRIETTVCQKETDHIVFVPVCSCHHRPWIEV